MQPPDPRGRATSVPAITANDEVRFHTTAGMMIPSEQLTKLPLEQQHPSPHVHYDAGCGIRFDCDGWYEVLLCVHWDETDQAGTRFAHTRIPDQEPLHSEAIDASVLARISQGQQLLRGNSLFGPDRTTGLVLEVWHDSPALVEVCYAEIVVRALRVPWTQ